jgi:DNA-binding response OmpR family regulator
VTTTQPKKILIIDDSPLVTGILQQTLAEAGFAAFAAQHMDQLEAHLAERTFDLILMDVQMPEIFGDDVAMVLKEVRGVQAPIYLVSDLDEAELEKLADASYVAGYLSKRDGVDTLVRRVTSLLSD